MDKIKVKICGITNLEDALMAAELGAHALGFIFAPSPRRVTPQQARAIISALPPFVKTVGVFVNEGLAAIRKTKGYCGLDLVQLHGDESADLCQALMPGSIKALRIKDHLNPAAISPYQTKVRALLLDTYCKGKAGGTGKTFDWQLALTVKKLGLPIILSGGLGPSNIAGAIDMVGPCAVDVNSGVEERAGKKSPALLKALMEKVNGGKSSDA